MCVGSHHDSRWVGPRALREPTAGCGRREGRLRNDPFFFPQVIFTDFTKNEPVSQLNEYLNDD